MITKLTKEFRTEHEHNHLLDKAAAELVEELLSCPEGKPWFYVIRLKVAELALALKELKK